MKAKRYIFLMLILCMVLTLLPVPASAATVLGSGQAGDDITWTMYDDGTLVFSGSGDMFYYSGNVGIPWLEAPIEITAVVFEDGITGIGSYALSGCANLTNITIPDSVTSIGEYAFWFCSGLTSITIPDSVTSIGRSAFSNCSGLTSITMPDHLGLSASEFNGCTSLTEITIPDGMTAIPSNVFNGCKKLQNVTIPDSVTSIGSYAFAGCKSFTSIIIPEGVTTIGNGAFSGCEGLTSVSIPNAVTSIGGFAFSGCNSLTEITIPASVNSLGYRAFRNSENLTTVTVMGNNVCIEEYVFENCASLESITFTGSAPIIYSDVFSNVTTTAYYPADDASWTSDVMKNYSGKITWLPSGHTFQAMETVDATCEEQGYTTYTCADCGYIHRADFVNSFGHEYGEWVVTKEPNCSEYGEQEKKCMHCGHILQESIQKYGDHIWDDETALSKTCLVCGKNLYRIYLDALHFPSQYRIWVDGKAYSYKSDSKGPYVELEHKDAKVITLHLHNFEQYPSVSDPHSQYPVMMKVWLLSFKNGTYTATYMEQFFNILQYAGSSIRIKGVKGIRMITSINKTTKNKLTGRGIAGYTLEEYGTALAWSDDLRGGKPLVLGAPYTKSNYAYKKGVADPVFKDTGKLVQYTNVLVGFNNDQCIPDIAMRPYIILKNANGEQITIYGGIVYRSIGYIAYQNRNVFKPGTDSYAYVWEIIHHVYGNKYDADYKG